MQSRFQNYGTCELFLLSANSRDGIHVLHGAQIRHNATVTVVHGRTPNPAEATKRADITVSATGVAQLVLRGHWLKKGAVVLDVGTSAVDITSFCDY